MCRNTSDNEKLHSSVFPQAEIHVSVCISACENISLEVEIYRASGCSCTCGNMGAAMC